MSRFRGSRDVPLNNIGCQEAVEAGFRLKKEGEIAFFVHDWQERTRMTAEIMRIAHPSAELYLSDGTSQRLGWLEGKEVNETTLDLMRYYISHPDVIPHPAFSAESDPPESFGAWLRSWFYTFDSLTAWSEREKRQIAVVTHNRNIQAVVSRRGNWIDFQEFDCEGSRPCEITRTSEYLLVVRHGSTDWGT